MSPKHPLHPTVLPGVTAVLTILTSLLATKGSVTPETAPILCASGVIVVISWLQWRKCNRAEEGLKRAEKRAPGVTDLKPPKGIEMTFVKNDVTKPDEPATTTFTCARIHEENRDPEI